MHRWLGIVLCLFFAMWFCSGMVMMYVGYPKLTDAERLQHLPPLLWPQPAAGKATIVIDARSGQRMLVTDAQRAIASASAYAGPGMGVHYLDMPLALFRRHALAPYRRLVVRGGRDHLGFQRLDVDESVAHLHQQRRPAAHDGD